MPQNLVIFRFRTHHRESKVGVLLTSGIKSRLRKTTYENNYKVLLFCWTTIKETKQEVKGIDSKLQSNLPSTEYSTMKE